MPSSPDVAIVGGGVAGLTAAALLARAGAAVTVFEHHNVPGGCASFYQRDGYRFDVGATVVNGFGERGIHSRVFRHLGVDLAAERLDPAMVVHLPDRTIVRYGDERWARERVAAFGSEGEPFWRQQERIADRVWEFSTGLPCLPADRQSIAHLARIFRPRHLPLLALQGRSLSSLLPEHASPHLRAFVDMQLLITAQCGSDEADLAFGCAALDIARAGTYHLSGGISDIAVALARSVRKHGGEIRYKTGVTALRANGRRIARVELSNGSSIAADNVICAIPIENLCSLLGEELPQNERLVQRWAAVTAHVGVPPGAVPDDAVLHHHVLHDAREAMGEANTAFVSISAASDRARARNGGRAITISTHTDPAIWERARRNGTLESRKRQFAQRLSASLERVLGAVEPEVFELGTPFTFERYTLRARGLVGGVPQTVTNAGLRGRSHRTRYRNLLACGDTVFPGQSTVGATLSAINAVRALAPAALRGLGG